MSDSRRGIVYGIAAYVLWGLFPLYLPLLRPSGSVEILAQRMVWSLATVLVILVVRRNWRWVRALVDSPRRMLLVVIAALLITANWGTFIFAVNTGHTVDASLGYFISPLVNVAFAVLVFRERLRPAQWAAVGLGTAAVLVLTVDYGSLPWIGLILAAVFGTYALMKKLIKLDGPEALSAETVALFLPALGVLIAMQAMGTGTFGHISGVHSLLMVGVGILTALPLLFFGACAIRVRMTTLAMLQYIAPIMQFLVGWLVFGEHMSTGRWIGFVIVWVALVVLSADLLRHAHRGRALRAEAAALDPAAG
ncbi:MAG: EamA family transporter RarD [Streptosporangiales bacterium]|nr:EamA family transporter RarD [Streptosporangiales bacterium]